MFPWHTDYFLLSSYSHHSLWTLQFQPFPTPYYLYYYRNSPLEDFIPKTIQPPWLAYGNHTLKWNQICCTFRKVMVFALEAQTWNISLLETRFIGHRDFTVAWYSATNNDLPGNNQFPKWCSQGHMNYLYINISNCNNWIAWNFNDIVFWNYKL